MAQRHVCPSMGILRHSIATEASSIPRCSSRSLHSTARRQDDKPSDAAPPLSQPITRRARNVDAFKQINKLQPGGLARGNFPSGQVGSQPPRAYNANNFGASVEELEASGTRAAPRFAKFTPRPTATHDGAPSEGRMVRGPSFPPEGRMARAPGNLGAPRNNQGNRPFGPNLGGRSAGRGGPKGKSGPGGREQGPKKRDRKERDSGAQSSELEDVGLDKTMTDGMVHHLLRLQRKEWDRVPYEPKYAIGSFAAQELIHEGRELFRGEAPPVKIWGKLERKIGVVGMFGAEAHLKVRRVPDGDEVPFGQELEVIEENQKEVAVQQREV